MNGTVQGADLSLSRDQEQLLRNALASNPKGSTGDVGTIKRPSSTIVGNGAGIYSSPPEEAPGSGTLGVDDSPFLDYELEDGQFDWDNSQDNLFPDLPGMDSAEGDHHDKRKASIDSDGLETGASKRREGEEKTAKKPGRKPLTAEPTTKRKAQNRAAQRAFRERKERHLKDLETKVDDLEKASEATNHENGRLRAQVEKLNIELREYRKRVSLIGSAPTASPPLANSQNRGSQSSNEFQFAFPKFGDLPSSFMSNGSMAKTSTTSPTSQNPGTVSNPNLPYFGRTNSTGSAAVSSPTGNQGPQSATDNSFISNNITFSSSDLQDLTGLFSPAVLESASRSNSTDYISFKGGKSASPSVRHGSTSTVNGNSPMPKTQRNSSTSMTASPISSVSQNGLDSSCGTTPESTCESPDNSKAAEPTLNTISEETAGPHKPEGPVGVLKSPSTEISGIDWLVQQNNGQFDPVLFGDYRDPQDNVLNNSFGDFFNDAFQSPQDFNSPYNTGESIDPVQSQKRDLMKEVEEQQNGGFDESVTIGNQTYDCGQMWERVRQSEKYNSGEHDMDDLCSQLKAKAKCSGQGAVIDKKDMDQILGPSLKEKDPRKMFL